MTRAVVSKTILDSLIRAKLASLEGCRDVEPLPVTFTVNGNGCNWSVPGFVGEGRVVKNCSDRMAHYLDFLQAQFNIPGENRKP